MPVKSYQSAVNVKAYGAKGDDTTNDTVAVEAAITARLASGQAEMLPAGTYLINATLTIPSPSGTYNRLSLIGDGSSQTTIKKAASFTGDAMIYAATDVEDNPTKFLTKGLSSADFVSCVPIAVTWVLALTFPVAHSASGMMLTWNHLPSQAG